jgi:dihydrofolate synthase/folylpolyglutamate synthase
VNRNGSFASLDDWLAWLDTLSPREIELGLDRVRTVLARMDLPRPELVIHVAGTNGKGSTAAMLEALFLGAGRRVGCYTSPHVLHYQERMRVQGRELDEETIVAAFRDVEAARQTIILTYFEFGTLAALSAFAKADADVLILEIGLGGRLDAVNAVEPDAAIITNVSLDHCDWLGEDVEAIAFEKAGVMRMDIPVIYGSPAMPRAIVSEAQRRHADLRAVGRDFHASIEDSAWSWRGQKQHLAGLARPSLRGDFQIENAAAALAVLEALGFEDMLSIDAVNAALSRTQLPGRLQRIDGRRHWLLDVAHNPDAARVLAASLQLSADSGRLIAVLGVLADKDLDGILDALCPVVDEWIAVHAQSPRALPALQLAARIANRCDRPCRVGGEIGAGLRMATELGGPNDRMLVTGSFYTVGPALALLEKDDSELA